MNDYSIIMTNSQAFIETMQRIIQQYELVDFGKIIEPVMESIKLY